MPISDFRIVLNSSMNELGKRCRRPGWRKFGAGSPRGFNNQDLHDKLGDSQTTCVPNDNNCTCPVVPDCLRLVDYEYGVVLNNCVDGESSDSPEWDGTLESTGTCSWGFAYGVKSFGGKTAAIVLSLASCSGGINVFEVEIVVKLANGTGLIVWKGESLHTPIGTYTRTDGCDETETIVFENCAACTAPVVTANISSGDITYGSFLALFATEGATIFFTTDGSTPDNTSELYVNPFPITESSTIKAIAYTGTCVGEVATFTYTVVLPEDFLFEFTCDTEDQAGVFDEFDPNGSPDYNWRLNFTKPEIDVVSLEIYETNALGVWVTGQSWGTKYVLYPEELDGLGYTTYPLVLFEDGVRIADNYADPPTYLIYGLDAGTHNWTMFGQPFTPLVGFFKLIFTYVEDGETKTITSVIPHECEDYYGDGDDYGYIGGDDVEASDPSRLININLTRNTNTKTGAALVGDVGDFWNEYAFSIDSEPERANMDLLYADSTQAAGTGSNTAITINTPDISNGMFSGDGSNSHTDPMMDEFGVVSNFDDLRQIRITELLPGTYDVVVYGHGISDNEQLKCRVGPGGGSLGIYKSTINGSGWTSGVWEDEVNCVTFPGVEISSSTINLVIDLSAGDSGGCYISGIQISRRA